MYLCGEIAASLTVLMYFIYNIQRYLYIDILWLNTWLCLYAMGINVYKCNKYIK